MKSENLQSFLACKENKSNQIFVIPNVSQQQNDPLIRYKRHVSEEVDVQLSFLTPMVFLKLFEIKNHRLSALRAFLDLKANLTI